MTSYTFIERRRWPRLVINAPGTIVTVSNGLRIKNATRCTIIDISKGGALLEIDSAVVEDHFYLEMDSEPNNRLTCSVVRRAGKRIGVQFVHDLDPVDALDDARPWRLEAL